MWAMKRINQDNGIRKIILGSGEIRYEARVHRGSEHISKRHKRYNDAVSWKRAMDKEIDEGNKPVAPQPKDIFTVADAVSSYTKHKAASKTPLPSNRITEFSKVELDIGDLLLHDPRSINVPDSAVLDHGEIINWLTLLMSEPKGKFKNGEDKPPYAAASARKFFYCLKKAVSWHKRKHKYNLDPDLFKLDSEDMPAAWGGHRERLLQAGEEDRLYAGGLVGRGRFTRADWEAIIGFALETAMRTQEIVLAEWSHLFDDDRKLRIPKKNSKTKTSRIVLMSLAARKILKSQRERCPQGQKRIFFQITSPDALTEAFIRLTKRVGIEDLHFHDLRHEAVTRLCASGKLKQMEIMAMTGHKSSATFQRYAHLITAENDTYLD